MVVEGRMVEQGRWMDDRPYNIHSKVYPVGNLRRGGAVSCAGVIAVPAQLAHARRHSLGAD